MRHPDDTVVFGMAAYLAIHAGIQVTEAKSSAADGTLTRSSLPR
jgi:allophanate hydrolase subunit 2